LKETSRHWSESRDQQQTQRWNVWRIHYRTGGPSQPR
jgi:hypothetical protein